ncbi:MAG: 30S ribosomal protein THX [Gammaproteobacteria bacterium]|nr:30S ribosomal protein THX [Gammaproteobacteria bacterium]
MGKGDIRTRRGKIYRGTFGKLRPKDPKKRARKAAAPQPAPAAPNKPAKR